MTANIRNPHVRTLYTLGCEDETSLQFPLPDNIFGFHAQQAFEKLMKALISAHGPDYPYTHRLQKLADQLLIECQEVLPSTPYDLFLIEPYAVERRYDFGTPLSDDERLQIRESIAIVREHILARILALESTTPAP